jgi:hypothetical protein
MINCVEESPSLLVAIVRFPGAVLRLPTEALDTMKAVNDLTERVDRLLTALERVEGGMNRAGSGIDLASVGISAAASGLEQAVGILDSSLPSLSDSALALRALTERLGLVAVELANELPKATRSLQEITPELSGVVSLLDERFAHLDTVVTELARLMESVVGSIPSIWRVLRPPSVPFQPG